MVLLLKRCRWSMNGYVMLTRHSLDGNLFIEGKVLLTCAHDNCLFVCVESVLLVIGVHTTYEGGLTFGLV